MTRQQSDISTVREFIMRYYRPDRLTSRDYPDYKETLIASHEQDFERDGYDLISHHDCKEGETIIFGTPPDWATNIRVITPAK